MDFLQDSMLLIGELKMDVVTLVEAQKGFTDFVVSRLHAQELLMEIADLTKLGILSVPEVILVFDSVTALAPFNF